MANVIINDKHLTDIGNSLRKHLGETKVIQTGEAMTPIERQVSKTKNTTDWDTSSGSYENTSFYKTITIAGAKKLKVDMAYGTYSSSYGYVQVWEGKEQTPSGTKYSGTKKRIELIFEGDTVSFYFYTSGANLSYFGYYAEIIPLNENEEEITEALLPVYETVKNDFLPSEMSVAIDSIDPKDMVNSWIADTEHYGITTWSNAGSKTVQNITLPDGVQFEDIVYLSGVATSSSTGSSGSTDNNFPYVYCPSLWNHIIEIPSNLAWVKDQQLYFCGGFGNSSYSSTYAPGPVYGITEDNTVKEAFYYSNKYFIMISPTPDERNISFTSSFSTPTNLLTRAYALAKYSKTVMIYKKREV